MIQYYVWVLENNIIIFFGFWDQRENFIRDYLTRWMSIKTCAINGFKKLVLLLPFWANEIEI